MPNLGDEWEALDAFLIGDADAPPPSDLGEPPSVESQESADAALRRLARLDREEANARQVADAEIQRVSSWLADRVAGIESRRAWITAGLEAFMRGLNRATGSKSMSLPWGKVGLSAQGRPRMDVIEEAAAVAWLEEHHPAGLKVTKAVAKSDLKVKPGPAVERLAEPGFRYHAAVLETGETVPGVYLLVRVEDRFSATPSKADAL